MPVFLGTRRLFTYWLRKLGTNHLSTTAAKPASQTASTKTTSVLPCSGGSPTMGDVTRSWTGLLSRWLCYFPPNPTANRDMQEGRHEPWPQRMHYLLPLHPRHLRKVADDPVQVWCRDRLRPSRGWLHLALFGPLRVCSEGNFLVPCVSLVFLESHLEGSARHQSTR